MRLPVSNQLCNTFHNQIPSFLLLKQTKEQFNSMKTYTEGGQQRQDVSFVDRLYCRQKILHLKKNIQKIITNSDRNLLDLLDKILYINGKICEVLNPG